MTNLTEAIEHHICIEITFLRCYMFCQSTYSRISYHIEFILNLLQSRYYIIQNVTNDTTGNVMFYDKIS